MLSKIRWTDTDGQSYLEGQPGFFDRIAKQNRESDDRLGWQFFCSTTGFLRFYPGSLKKRTVDKNSSTLAEV